MPTRLDVDMLRSDFKRAAGDKKITRAEVKRIIRRARRGNLHESEAKTFKREAGVYKDKFTEGGSRELTAFINNRMRKVTVLDEGPHPDPIDRDDPAVLKADRKRLEQQVVKNGKLFRHGVSGNDPEQNYIGDCYLVGAMSAVAHSTPEVIEKAFKRNRDGSYTVTLYDLRNRPHAVTIDVDLPRNGWYGYYYARSQDPRELWPALLEKAFAVWKGSYTAIEGGVPGEAMQAITGKKSVDIEMRGKGVTEESVYEALKAAVAAGKPAIAATYGERQAARYKGTGMHDDHTYAVFGVSTRNGERYVKLRNPWGESEPKGNGRDDGIFEIPMSKLMRLCSNVSING